MLSGMHVHDPIEEEAERIAPYPKVEPSWAGMTGFAIAGFSLILFCGLAGIELEDHPNPRVWLAFMVMLAVGFAAPFIYFNNQKRRHFAEWERHWRKAKGREEIR
jgi:hypothetical protein